MLSPGGRLIVGVDLKKDARRLVLAYDDAAGVTAAFNLNLLARINRELGGTFDLAAFRHEAIYNPREGRIEMHLESMRGSGREGSAAATSASEPASASIRRTPTSTPFASSRQLARPPAGAAARVDGRGQPVQRARADFGLTLPVWEWAHR